MALSDFRRGFTLVDLASLVVVCVTVAAIAGPTLNLAQKQKFATTSERNLGIIGQGSAMYASANAGRIATYSWGVPQGQTSADYLMPDGTTRRIYNDQDGAAYQSVAIMMRMSGRINGPLRIRANTGSFTHRRLVHLPLWDFMGRGIRSFTWADPADANQLQWHATPLNYSFGSTVPYANGFPGFGYDESPIWSQTASRQRWAFATSYRTVPAAWAPRMPGTYGPVSDSPYLFIGGSLSTPLSQGRAMTEVAFPSGKVQMHEEFDRESFLPLFYGYDFASPAKLMFDGSINTERSGDASSAADPRNYPDNSVWTQRYIPLDTFPIPVTGLGESTRLDLRYRWTYDGLHGVDYTP